MDYKEELKKFGIEEDNYPHYDNAEKFASNFEKCTIFKPIESFSSNTSINDRD